MDGFSAIAPKFFLDFYGTTVGVDTEDGWPTVNEVIVPGIPAEVEVVIHDGQFYTLINGTLRFSFRYPQGQPYYFTPAIRPWRNFINVHERSEERRVGKECVSTCRSRWSPDN